MTTIYSGQRGTRDLIVAADHRTDGVERPTSARWWCDTMP
jgi:hypothetical protein